MAARLAAHFHFQVGSYILIGDTGVTGEFELTARKRKAYAVSAEGWRLFQALRSARWRLLNL
jgi:hypothetical protein